MLIIEVKEILVSCFLGQFVFIQGFWGFCVCCWGNGCSQKIIKAKKPVRSIWVSLFFGIFVKIWKGRIEGMLAAIDTSLFRDGLALSAAVFYCLIF